MRPFVLIILAALILTGIIISILEWYKKVPTGKAIFRNGFGGVKVVFQGGLFVIPEIQSMEIIDLRIKEISLEFTGSEAIMATDGTPLNFVGKLYLFVPPTPQDIFRVTQLISLEQLNDTNQLTILVQDKLRNTLSKTAKQMESTLALESPHAFKDKVLDALEMEVLGLEVEDFIIMELKVLTSEEKLKLKE